METRRRNRREFAKAALGCAVFGAGAEEKRILEPLAPGAKITLQLPGDFNDEDLQFAKQMGVSYVTVGTTGGAYDTFADIKRRVEAAGLKVSNIGNTNVHNMPEVTLNLPGRDEKIAEYNDICAI